MPERRNLRTVMTAGGTGEGTRRKRSAYRFHSPRRRVERESLAAPEAAPVRMVVPGIVKVVLDDEVDPAAAVEPGYSLQHEIAVFRREFLNAFVPLGFGDRAGAAVVDQYRRRKEVRRIVDGRELHRE